MKKTIALQLYSIRSAINDNFYSILKSIKEMGYDGVEFAGLNGHTPKEVKEMVESLELVPISAHISYDDLRSDTENIAKDYSEIGVKYIAIPYLNEENRPGAEKYQETVENMKRFSSVLKKYNLSLLYHNHEFEFEKIDDKYKLDILFSDFKDDELQTEIDLCWTAVAGVNPVEYLIKYTGRSPVVHFKDFYKKGHLNTKLYDLIGIDDESPADNINFEYRPIGTGMQDIPSLLQAAKKAGCDWIIVEQDEPTHSKGLDAMECAKISISNLRKMM